MSQVITMLARKPAFVSVEVGGNELLQAQVGLLVPNVTYVPFATFQEAYREIVDSVKATRARAVLVGLALDVPGQVDYVLTPADVEFLNSMAAQMDAEIQSLAHQNRYAFFRLDVLYAQSKDGVSFSLAAYLGTGTPYGPVISLDGVHPNSAGQTILANAAISAINDAYHVRIAPVN